jgi:hypothetical protein
VEASGDITFPLRMKTFKSRPDDRFARWAQPVGATLQSFSKDDSKQDLLYHCHQLSMDHGEAGLALAKKAGGSGFERLKIYLSRYMMGIFGDFGSCFSPTSILDPALVPRDGSQ